MFAENCYLPALEGEKSAVDYLLGKKLPSNCESSVQGEKKKNEWKGDLKKDGTEAAQERQSSFLHEGEPGTLAYNTRAPCACE